MNVSAFQGKHSEMGLKSLKYCARSWFLGENPSSQSAVSAISIQLQVLTSFSNKLNREFRKLPFLSYSTNPAPKPSCETANVVEKLD
jgi:hypothetical protein